MRIRFDPTTVTAMVLLGMGLAVAGGWKARPPQPVVTVLGASARSDVERCLEQVGIVHDVYWAAACMQVAPDDLPDCTLPPERAAPLNAARAAADQRCLTGAP